MYEYIRHARVYHVQADEGWILDEMKRVMKLEAEREAEEKRRQAAETRLLFERSGKLRAMREAAQRREELEFDMKMLAKIKEDLDRQAGDELRRKARSHSIYCCSFL